MGKKGQTITLVIAVIAAMQLLIAPAPAASQNPPTSEFDIPSDADIHYIDKGDGGDDPWKPGCHWHYGDASCSAPEFLFMGDYCSPDGRILYEWTDNRCHEPKDDLARHDCNKLCQEKYGQPGGCVVARKACRSRQATQDSASCVCRESAG